MRSTHRIWPEKSHALARCEYKKKLPSSLWSGRERREPLFNLSRTLTGLLGLLCAPGHATKGALALAKHYSRRTRSRAALAAEKEEKRKTYSSSSGEIIYRVLTPKRTIGSSIFLNERSFRRARFCHRTRPFCVLEYVYDRAGIKRLIRVYRDLFSLISPFVFRRFACIDDALRASAARETRS